MMGFWTKAKHTMVIFVLETFCERGEEVLRDGYCETDINMYRYYETTKGQRLYIDRVPIDVLMFHRSFTFSPQLIQQLGKDAKLPRELFCNNRIFHFVDCVARYINAAFVNGEINRGDTYCDILQPFKPDNTYQIKTKRERAELFLKERG